MGDKFYKTDSFLALHKEWSERLTASGFNDMEYKSGNKEYIKPVPGSNSWPVDYERAIPRLIYYQMAVKFYWDYTFRLPRHKEVWRLHSLGHSKRQIEALIEGESNASRVLLKIYPDFFAYIKAQQDYDAEED